ncbi:MAG TPA: hypothetical protein VLC46_13975 [Thermoanaerobaculia bacterium]|jgi:hypothetical protein|nr:hypothetical protein [Thermoanaerobaculia bacterium]
MSTGQKHNNEKNELSFESINAGIKQYGPTLYTSETVAPQTAADRATSMVASYAVVRPILAALAVIPLIPATWRAALSIFITTLDGVTDSFKAGKDLAVGDGVSSTVEMEPKLPVG